MEIANYIAAIDLGSSKIVGIIGTRNSDNVLSVQAIEKEASDSCIKRGIYYEPILLISLLMMCGN